ncbi:MAG: DnaD domain protein [Clostridia bacterium]
MAFCSFAKDASDDGFVALDNKFISQYMTACDGDQLKVYILGLQLCNAKDLSNSLDYMCDFLQLDKDTVTKCFGYWADQNLITIYSYEPFQVQYRPLKFANTVRHFKKEKYEDFNQQLQGLFPDVSLDNVNQYLPYYDFMEEYKISPEVMIMITQYCVSLRGTKIRCNYVLTVAKNWVNEGVRSASDVENRIKQYETVTESLRLIAQELGKKTEITVEDKELYIKWTKNWGFNLDAILTAAKLCKKKGGMSRLDNALDEYFRNSCLGALEIQSYAKNKETLLDYAKQTVPMLGLWYDSLDFVVEKYISPWLAKGFDIQAIKLVAEFCFSNSVRTLEGMNIKMNNFAKAGCVTAVAINQYLGELVARDKQIKRLVELTGSARNVTSSDRDMFNNWTAKLGFDESIIAYACEIASCRPYAFGYVNNMLLRWKKDGVDTLEKAKKCQAENANAFPAAKKENAFLATDKKFTQEELSSVFDDINDVDNWMV